MTGSARRKCVANNREEGMSFSMVEVMPSVYLNKLIVDSMRFFGPSNLFVERLSMA